MIDPLLDQCRWPIDRLGEALAAMAARAGLAVSAGPSPVPPAGLDGRLLARWLDAAAAFLGLEAEAATVPYARLTPCLASAAPAILRAPAGPAPSFLVLVAGSHRGVTLLTPSLKTVRVAGSRLAEYARGDEAALAGGALDELMNDLRISARSRDRVRSALLDARLHEKEFDGLWLLRPEPSAGFGVQLALAGLRRRLALLAGAHAAEYACWILAWWMVGLGAMSGRIDRGWMIAWALLLVTMVPLRALVAWLQGAIAIPGGAILRQRLLVGALRMDPDAIRREGAGHLLGRVLESETLESLALTGGFLALASVMELVLAALVLSAGASGVAEVVALLAWTAVVLGMGWRYLGRGRSWAALRLFLTHDLVERMIGHRTRLAQQTPEHWHDREDEQLDGYINESRRTDQQASVLAAVAPRGWLLIAVAAVTPSFVSGSATPGALAVAIGGALLGYRAFKRLAAGLWHLVEAAVAWRQVRPLFEAARRREPAGLPEFVIGSPERARGPAIQVHDVSFRYPSRSEPVLRAVNLRIEPGDRLLLEGPSGGGKSTLASLLVSMHTPNSGLLLAGGLDRRTLGAEGWRRRVASAPQFQDNHVITGTFAFNMLMSRPSWPPRDEDVALLEPLCRELGLDGLVARMPGGVMQMVGESGWQLSHGERSRLFLARALLQDADLVVLDESFASLDPENLARSLRCTRERARALLVIAHR